MYFCYLLKSLNEKFSNDTYIGFTDDPIKRLKQHNGIIKGGAKKTSKKRPWALVLVVSNFPNKILALKFEWAWTNPFMSNFTSDQLKTYQVPKEFTKNKKKHYESIEFKLKVINLLINTKVYEKISLYLHAFDSNLVYNNTILPNNLHILEITNEQSFKESIKNKIYFYDNQADLYQEENINILDKCIICSEDFSSSKNDSKFNPSENNILSSEDEVELQSDQIVENKFNSLNTTENLAKCPHCKSLFHMICLAQTTLENQNQLIMSLIPKDTDCLICTRSYNWSEFIKN